MNRKQFRTKGAILSSIFNGRFFNESDFFHAPETVEALQNIPLYIHPAIIPKNMEEYYYKSDHWSLIACGMLASAGYGWHPDSWISMIWFITSSVFDSPPKLRPISGYWGKFSSFLSRSHGRPIKKILELGHRVNQIIRRSPIEV